MRALSFAAAACLMSASLAAHADELFTLSDGTNTITFDLPAAPVPMFNAACPASDSFFCVLNVPVTVNGTPEMTNYIAFFTAAAGGGLELEQDAAFILAQGGPAVFGGTLTAPMFQPEIVNLTNFPTTPSVYQSDFTLTVTDNTVPVAATPEPSSFALLGTGLLGAAGVLKRRFA